MIYVDPLVEYEGIPWKGRKGRPQSCHLFTDGAPAELMRFAFSIRLPLAWYQPSPPASWPHFDLSPMWRARAIEAGAREVSHREGAEIRRAARAAAGAPAA